MRRLSGSAANLALYAIAAVAFASASLPAGAEEGQLVRVSIQLRSGDAGSLIKISLDDAEIHSAPVLPLPAGGESGPEIEMIAVRDLERGSRHVLTALVPEARIQARFSWTVARDPQWILVSYDASSRPGSVPTLSFATLDAAPAGK